MRAIGLSTSFAIFVIFVEKLNNYSSFINKLTFKYVCIDDCYFRVVKCKVHKAGKQ